MSELCTPLEVGCSVETLGQYPSAEAEAMSIEGLKRLFLEAQQHGYGNAIDQYIADSARLVEKPSDAPVVESLVDPGISVRESPQETSRRKRGVLSLFARIAS